MQRCRRGHQRARIVGVRGRRESGDLSGSTHHPYDAPMSPVASPPAPALPGHLTPRSRAWRAVLSSALTVGLVVGGIAFLSSPKRLSDAEERMSIAVPRTWTDITEPEAGQAVNAGGVSRRVPDLKASPVVTEMLVSVTVEPRVRELAGRHAAEVERRCQWAACVARDQPIAVEVNGRPGLEQVIAHAGREWTIVLTVESPQFLVSAAGRAGELTGRRDIEDLRAMLHTIVIAR